jgi:hypothetical protein
VIGLVLTLAVPWIFVRIGIAGAEPNRQVTSSGDTQRESQQLS